jgi:hypothetical protein
MSTAAVGLSPKMVVRSLVAERGSAEAPSSRRVSLLTVPLTLPLPPGAGVLTAGLSVWVVVLEDEEPEADGADGVAGLADGVVGLVELEPLELACASVSVTGAASTATPSRATSKDFIPHLLAGVRSKAGATDCTGMRGLS